MDYGARRKEKGKRNKDKGRAKAYLSTRANFLKIDLRYSFRSLMSF
jgi:hypothetical protein